MRHRLLAHLCLLLALAIPARSVRADGAVGANPVQLRPVFDLGDQTHEERLFAEKIKLAHQSLHGPATELIFGSVIVSWVPIVSIFVAFLAGPPWFECFGEGDDAEGDACEARMHRQQESARRKAIAVGSVMSLLGIGLIGHGATRMHAIRTARREVRLSRFNLGMNEGGANVQLGLSF